MSDIHFFDANVSLILLTFKSQHLPVPHEALSFNVHVVALQHTLSHFSGSPQSHCSPGSTKPFPQTDSRYDLRGGGGRKVKSCNYVSTCVYYNMSKHLLPDRFIIQAQKVSPIGKYLPH